MKINLQKKYKHLCLFYFSLFLTIQEIHSQEKKDSLEFYEKLQKKAGKYGATRLLYNALIEDPEEVDDSVKVLHHKRTKNPYRKYEGKTIRNINILRFDPFGFDVNNYKENNPMKIEKWGNKLHVTTKEAVVRNILLFEEDSKLDPLEISESERLLRLSPYLNDARIYIQTLRKEKKDSIDILVVIHDKWTTTIKSDLVLHSPNIVFVEKNFLGMGSLLKEDVGWSKANQSFYNKGTYTLFNINKTFINSTISYTLSKNDRSLGVALDRPFYSPLTQWAGGVSFLFNNTIFNQINLMTGDVTGSYKLNYKTYDLWGARSLPLYKNTTSTNRRSSNFIFGARYYHINYFDRPSFDIDTNYMHRHQTMLLANYGFTLRKYYRERYLYKFGTNEDIPQGMSVEFVLGKMNREFSSLLYYSGLKLAAGKYFKDLGYISGSLSGGTFYNKNYTTLNVINFDALYFSDLILREHYFFRYFIRYKLVHGMSREPYERININGLQMNGFNSKTVSGTSKMILNTEFVMYSPIKIIGFRFAPVLSIGVATIGNNFSSLFTSSVYSAFTFGVLIRNELFIINTFSLSVGFFPIMPGYSNYTLKVNPISSFNVRARDYFISKPDLVTYQ